MGEVIPAGSPVGFTITDLARQGTYPEEAFMAMASASIEAWRCDFVFLLAFDVPSGRFYAKQTYLSCDGWGHGVQVAPGFVADAEGLVGLPTVDLAQFGVFIPSESISLGQ